MNEPEHLLPSRADQTVVLVVDDEPLIRNIVRIALEAEGYFILAAADGEEGLALSRSFPGTIHLLLSDVMMPRMDGLQLAEALTAERPATTVLLMSGQLDLTAERPFLRKPFAIGVLREHVRGILQPRGKAGL